MEAKRIAEFIKNNDNFVIAGHINADGDAISASLACAQVLEKLNKNYKIMLDDVVPDRRYNFLKKFDEIVCARDDIDFKADAAIMCDTPTVERLGAVSKYLPDFDHIVKIDHHPNEEVFGKYSWVDTDSSSTTCLIYQVFEELDITYDKDLAQTILSGIMFDTGRFSYQNTRSIDFLIASKMTEYGAETAYSYKKIFSETSLSALKTIGKGLKELETFYDNQIGIIHLNLAETSRNPPGEIEELAAFTTAVRGTHVGVFIREVSQGFFKVSLRSKDEVNVNKIAAHFGGGGHIKASGCRIEANTYEDVKALLLEQFEKQLKELKLI